MGCGGKLALKKKHTQENHHEIIQSARSLFIGYSAGLFSKRLYPGSFAALAHVRPLGPTIILSDGDVVFQPRKVHRFGVMGSGRGPCTDLHSQRADDGRCRATLPGPTLCHGGRQTAHFNSNEKDLGRSVIDCMAAPGTLCPRPRNCRCISAG
jgi:hypothetical protein